MRAVSRSAGPCVNFSLRLQTAHRPGAALPICHAGSGRHLAFAACLPRCDRCGGRQAFALRRHHCREKRAQPRLGGPDPAGDGDLAAGTRHRPVRRDGRQGAGYRGGRHHGKLRVQPAHHRAARFSLPQGIRLHACAPGQRAGCRLRHRHDRFRRIQPAALSRGHGSFHWPRRLLHAGHPAALSIGHAFALSLRAGSSQRVCGRSRRALS